MKYIIYTDYSGKHADIFQRMVSHKVRAESLLTEIKEPITINSAGTFIFDDHGLDEIVAKPGSVTLGIDDGDAMADAACIKEQLRFF